MIVRIIEFHGYSIHEDGVHGKWQTDGLPSLSVSFLGERMGITCLLGSKGVWYIICVTTGDAYVFCRIAHHQIIFCQSCGYLGTFVYGIDGVRVLVGRDASHGSLVHHHGA